MSTDVKGKGVLASSSSPESRESTPPPAAQGSRQNVSEVVQGMSDEEALYTERVEKLRELLRQRQSAIRVTNPNFEMGRPELQRSGNMAGDPTNIYNRPSVDQLLRIRPKAISNNMANSEDMARITAALEGLGIPSEEVQAVIIQAVIYCKDASSSTYLDPKGVFEWNGGAVAADQVLAVLKRDAETLRRVCRHYAPVTWQYMIVNNAPPSDWAAMGFAYEDRFAAFDCFDYVENAAAVQPLEGLIRRPTPREKIAHNTHKTIALDRANRNQTYANLQTEITGGRLGPEIQRNFNNANNK